MTEIERRVAEIGSVHAIVPLKVIKRSKTRLSALSSADRSKLTRAMFVNVLVALRKSRRVSDITVVSGDRSVSRMAHRYGARFLWEGKRRGLNRALRLGLGELNRNGSEAALIIHADLPRLTTRDVDHFVRKSNGIQIAIAPCKNGTGTNALLLRPPTAIPPSFGKGSFRKHLSLAKRTGLRWKVLRIPGVQFDIDDPQDLEGVQVSLSSRRDYSFLRKLTSKSLVKKDAAFLDS